MENSRSCHLTTKACVKMPDIFNIVQDSIQHLYFIYMAYVPILLLIFPQNKVLNTLNAHPVLFSIILPASMCVFFLLFTLPFVCLAIQFVKKNMERKTEKGDVDFATDSLIFRDLCDCSEARISVSRKEESKQKKLKVICSFF